MQYVHDILSVGAIIMVHGDDNDRDTRRPEGVLEKAEELKNRLSGFRVKLDATDNKPGWKFAAESIPVRVEIGPKDIEANQAVLARDTGEKIVVSLDEL